MTIRFFILQTQYHSTLDFSNEALLAAEKGLRRLWEAYKWLQQSAVSSQQSTGIQSTVETVGMQPASDPALDEKVRHLVASFETAMNEDFNTAKVLASMFELVPVLNGIKDKHIAADALSTDTWKLLTEGMKTYTEDILGLKDETEASNEIVSGIMQLVINLRKEAKTKKDYATSDAIRKSLQELGITLKDEKDGNVSYQIS